MRSKPLHVRVNDIQFFVRNVRTRMPFRYGTACVRHAPVLHVRMDLECDGGKAGTGFAADILPPRWFDKEPQKDFAENVADLLAAARFAAEVYLQLTCEKSLTPFQLWHEAYTRILDFGEERGLNHLTSGHGSSLMERAVIDAAGCAEGLTFQQLLVQDRLGFRPEAIHPELQGLNWRKVFGVEPLRCIFVRHTVGLADPILTSEIQDDERLHDGLPQSLEEYILSCKLRYFKVKVSGKVVDDLARLLAIAAILDGSIKDRYFVTLDGNEQFKSVSEFLELMRPIMGDKAFDRFFQGLLYVEQPFDRSIALDEKVCATLENLTSHRPVIIDESDSDLSSFKDAALLGYQGVSSKNCKGIYKSLLNRLLVEKFNQLYMSGEPLHRVVGRTSTEPSGPVYFMTGEDLMNTPVVPLHQDLATLSVLGIRHAERNGHHYFHGLDHLSLGERTQCLTRHAGLYVPFGSSGNLNIHDGEVDISSLQIPGFGVGVDTDLDSMIPLDRWEFGSLGIS